MSNQYAVLIASDPEHEKVFAEIYFGKKFVALVSQEEGLDRLRIEFPAAGLDESMISRAVDLESFQQALVQAAKRLEGDLPETVGSQ